MVEARGRGGASASPFSRHIYARSTSQTGPLLLFGEMLFHSEREAAQRVDRIERISDVSGGVRDCRATTRFAPHNLGSTGHPYRAQTERSPIALARLCMRGLPRLRGVLFPMLHFPRKRDRPNPAQDLCADRNACGACLEPLNPSLWGQGSQSRSHWRPGTS